MKPRKNISAKDENRLDFWSQAVAKRSNSIQAFNDFIFDKILNSLNSETIFRFNKLYKQKKKAITCCDIKQSSCEL